MTLEKKTGFPQQKFYRFLGNLINSKNIKNIDDLCTEFTKHHTEDYTNYYINIRRNDNLGITVLYPPKITFDIGELNEQIQMVRDTLETCVLDNKTLMPVFHIDKKMDYDRKFINSISSRYQSIKKIINTFDYLEHKDAIKFYKNYDGCRVVLFNIKNKWCISAYNFVYELETETNANNLVVTLFRNLFEEKSSYAKLNKDISYHFLLVHHRLGKCVCNNNWEQEIRTLLHLRSERVNTLELVDTDIGISPNERVHLSCKDELLAYLDKTNSDMIYNGKLCQRGLVMKHYSESSSTVVNFDTDLFCKISSRVKPYKNIHQASMIMYINNECNEILSYITGNHTDIVKRINNSLKTLSKEILEIYFLTQDKKNPDLYDALPRIYRDIKFAIHGVFIEKRTHDYRDSKIDNVDIKSSINITDIYLYLKNDLGGERVIELYKNRLVLMEKINNNISLEKYKKLNIFGTECTDTVIQTLLMFKTN